ncbi:hypothetical protein O181_010454 [Austropuccinia psidii MF-1]|uniref:Uncharacterized protein n=1 Tax=Austropuccinia psidii MF-1 TaxID=1389203 RepID=A0A9Q3GKV3_9BASI|nr:hypothetical protein [Austropuccinia psidii MF-1]
MVEIPSFPSLYWEFLVIDTPKAEDLILGFAFLNNFNQSIDWRKGLITFNADHRYYYDPFKSSRNDASGDSRTPSFLSSVDITSVSLQQSLLSSRDEVFQESQDVEEYNSVSSVHLFHGNVDVTPSSYHDSLEEWWVAEEEPEEIESVMKVVISSYHHYLEVFHKVKAEKHPAHHSYDHHIVL